MKLHQTVGAAAGLLALTVAGAAQAHHSFAMFDLDKSVTIEGTVQQFQWTNPHAEVIMLGGPAGQPAKVWSLELTAPAALMKWGWERRSLKAGDKVRIDISPLRDGNPGGAIRTAWVVETGVRLPTNRSVPPPGPVSRE